MSQDKIQITQILPEMNMRRQAAQVFYQAFARKIHNLEFFPRSREQAIRILAQSMRPELGFFAIEQGQVKGVIGLERDHGERFIYISRETFIEEFGWVGGFLRWLWYSCINLQDRRQGELRVQAIAVDESMRGKGAGTMLLNAAFDYARKIGYKAIRLEVVDTNPAAKKLYERLGFVTLKTSWFGPITSSAGFTAANYMRREV